MKKNNILYVHPINEFSGALKSIEEYLKLLKKDYNLYFLVPRGVASQRLKKYGKVISVYGLSKFDNSQIGYYKNLRWLLVIREIFLLFPTLYSIFSIKKKIKKIHLIHFNEITLVPTIFIFKFFFKVPFILHCRILFNKKNFLGKKIINFLKKNVNQIIAIDNDVKNSLPKELNIKIVRNIFFNKKIKLLSKNYNNEFLKLGYLGSFLKYKGVHDLIIVFNKLVKENYKIKLFLAGNFIKKNFLFNFFDLTNNIDKNLIKSKNIVFMGHIDKLGKFYNNIDVLCFPSYLNALGRQIFEAAFYNIPSIVCLKKNKSDSFLNNKTGLSFRNPGSKKEIEKKIKYFYYNRKKIKKMGLNANRLVSRNFDIKKNLKVIKNIYRSCLKKN